MQSTNISPIISYSSEQYLDIIKTIYEKHTSHNGKWLSKQSGISLYNLKKTEVRTIMSNEGNIQLQSEFYDYIISYKNELITLYADIINGLNQSLTPYIKGRIKNEESIINKLHKKRKEQNGAFSINKVLNDLLGFRIIDPNFGENITYIIEILNSLKTDGFRFQHKRRINGDYEAYHIYFMGKDAKYFPVELQIWDTKNEQTNLASHEIYKKEYTSWPEIYKKG
ncbi:hypothetical protein NiCM35_19830 [Niallia circulans]|uniref:hypothetical protein n=1 Tax=Niallia circulans TaxID=1397 RepID=UPI003D9712D5